jgi:hypothetical protein
LHAAIFERRATIPVEIGQDRRSFRRLSRETQRRAAAHRTAGVRNGRAILRDKHAANAIEGADAAQIVLNDRDAGRLPRRDRAVQFVNRRLLQLEGLGACGRLM